jgi:hypothetical protein
MADRWEEAMKGIKVEPGDAEAPKGGDPWAQAGVQKDEKPAMSPAAPQTFGHAASEALSAANPLPGLWSAIRHPLDTAKGLYQASADQAAQVVPSLKRGNYLDAAGHALGTFPLLGPAIEGINEQMDSDPVGAAGRAAGTIGSLAAAPALARGAGSTLKAMGRGMGKTALGLPAKAEAFGATPSRALMEDTSGFRPSFIARTGQQTMNTLKPQMEAAVSRSTTPVDLGGARAAVTDASDLAAREGNKLIHGQIKPMGEALAGNRVTSTPYPDLLSPRDALDLKRGFGDEFATYNPEIHTKVNALAKDVYGKLARGIHEAAPGSQELDQRIQSLIPVVHRAETVSRNAGLGQRVLTRPTRGLLPALLGYHKGGLLGAMLGLTGSEAAASPVPLMIGARGAYGAGRAVASPFSQRAAQVAPLLKRPQQ